MECVNPRCTKKLSTVESQGVTKKSMSGMLCASIPHAIAFLPNCRPAKASPRHAPIATWVRESNLKNLLSMFKVVNTFLTTKINRYSFTHMAKIT